MQRFLLPILIITTSIFSQTKDSLLTQQKDSFFTKKNILQKIVKPTIFSDEDLKKIDSLLIDYQHNSALVNNKDLTNRVNTNVSLDLLKLRLSRLNEKTPFNLAYNPTLEKVIKDYLLYRKKYYPALMAKAQYYFPIFEQYLSQYNIPLEIKYLAIVESALKAKAKSRVGASGLWQFMYSTGIQFNLKVNSYVDERYNPVKSTIAACKYLSQLYKIFNDWDLALAAYNSGPGNVTKAIKRSGGYKNYWNIRPYLPRETANYVPSFYATMYIFEYANEYDIYPESPKFFNFEIDTVHIKKNIGFAQISKKINIDEEVLEELNPSYKLNIIPSIKGKNYSLRLPKTKIITFLNNEDEIYTLTDLNNAKREKPLPKFFEMDKRIRYIVKNGDFLGKIANSYGVKVSDLKRWNNLKTSRLSIGKKLYIYPKKVGI